MGSMSPLLRHPFGLPGDEVLAEIDAFHGESRRWSYTEPAIGSAASHGDAERGPGR
jgi:hypothetical protein